MIDDLPDGVLREEREGLDARVKRLLQVLGSGFELLLGARPTVVLKVILGSDHLLHGSAKPALLRRDVQSHNARRKRVALIRAEHLATLPDNVPPVTRGCTTIPDVANVKTGARPISRLDETHRH